MATLNPSRPCASARFAPVGSAGQQRQSFLSRVVDAIGRPVRSARYPRLDLDAMPEYLRRDIGFIDWRSPSGRVACEQSQQQLDAPWTMSNFR